MTTRRSGFGIYGFEVTGLEAPDLVLHPSGAGWPELAVKRTGPEPGRCPQDGVGRAQLHFDEAHAELWISDTDFLELHRSPLRVRFATAAPLSDDLVAHPYIALAATVASHWLGRQILHGGGFIDGDQAWGLLGTKEAGKSSTLAWLLANGRPIISDDLLVLDGTSVFAGPRTVDLREDAAAVLGGEPVQIDVGRARWRLRPGPIAPVTPLGGIVHLEWGDEIVIEPVEPSERLVLLIANSVVGLNLVDASAYLALAALPTWRFVRPRRLDVSDDANAQLLAALG